MWDPPVLIPNTEVKPHRADGTVRDTVWESRTSGISVRKETSRLLGVLPYFMFVNKQVTHR